MKIAFLDLAVPSVVERHRYHRALSKSLKSGIFVLGEQVARFEEEFASEIHSEFAVGTGNGMDAIEIGIRSLGLGPGDEIITSPMTAYATVLAIVRSGATPVLADIDPDTGLLDLVDVSNKITQRTRAVILVHLYGHVSRMDEWLALVGGAGIFLIEDCAQSHLAKWDTKPSGSFGDFGAFSFYPTKNLGGFGDGGAITSSSRDFTEQARRLRNYGQTTRYLHEKGGLNSRLDEIQAGFLRAKLPQIGAQNRERGRIARYYHDHLSSEFFSVLRQPREQENHVYHLFVVTSAHRDALAEHMKEKGIGTLIHYPVVAHQQSAFTSLGLGEISLPKSETFAHQALSIPCRPGLKRRELEHVVTVMNTFRPS